MQFSTTEPLVLGPDFPELTGIPNFATTMTTNDSIALATLARCSPGALTPNGQPVCEAHLHYLHGRRIMPILGVNPLVLARNQWLTPQVSRLEAYAGGIRTWEKGLWVGIKMDALAPMVPNEEIEVRLEAGQIYFRPGRDDASKGMATFDLEFVLAQAGRDCIKGTMSNLLRDAAAFDAPQAPRPPVEVPTDGDLVAVYSFASIHGEQWLWAAASGDVNEFHKDQAAAEARGFKKPLAHGPNSTAKCMAALIYKFCPNDDSKLLRFNVYRMPNPLLWGQEQVVTLYDLGETNIDFEGAQRRVRHVVGRLNIFSTGSPREPIVEPFEGFVALD